MGNSFNFEALWDRTTSIHEIAEYLAYELQRNGFHVIGITYSQRSDSEYIWFADEKSRTRLSRISNHSLPQKYKEPSCPDFQIHANRPYHGAIDLLDFLSLLKRPGGKTSILLSSVLSERFFSKLNCRPQASTA